MKILILGGRGFLGSEIGNHLEKHEVYTFDRHKGGKMHFKGDMNSFEDLKKASRGMDTVINLVGLTPLFEPKNTTYYDVHVNGVENMLNACKKNNVSKIIHISALGADKNSDIEYLRTKGIGEEKVKNSKIDPVIFKPSVIYDENNELIEMLYKSAPLMLFPKIKTRMQLIHRSNVAELVSKAFAGEIGEGSLEIAGPKKLPLHKIAEKIYRKRGFPCVKFPYFFFHPVLKAVSSLRLFGIGKGQAKSINLDNTTNKNDAKRYIKLTDFESWIKKANLKT
ncbi:MAG: NAD(P)H-binding protein [Candidatus Pacearchaeota archaeon]